MSDQDSTVDPTDASDVDEQVAAASRIGKLFDVRLVIGGLLSVYGVILTVTGATDGHAAVARAAGVRINLWTGLAMLAVGLLFLLWVKLAPLQPPTEEELRDALSAGAAPSVEQRRGE
jgi:hypothetical protein